MSAIAPPRPAPAGTRTIVSRLRERAASMGDTVALREKDFGIWQEVTWSQFWDAVQDVAHGLLAMGVEEGDRVAIHAENRREWLYADHAIVACRAMTTGLYPTNPAAEVRHMLADSGSRVIFSEDQEQVDKVLAVIDDLPDLEHIVYIEPRGILGHYDHPRLVYWNDFIEAGQRHRAAHPDAVSDRMAAAEPDDIVTLIYTSGTTGPPKGAMLSNRNVEFAIDKLLVEGAFWDPGPDDVTLSYLPLCHVAERISTVWTNVASGTTVHFAESIETVQANLREVQPTIFFAVPRIWEKRAAGSEVRMNSASWFKRVNWRFWSRVADTIGRDRVANLGNHTTRSRLLYAIGHPFMFRALRDRIGLRECRTAGSGAAPIAPEILRFFFGIGVPIYEIYGMTENTAVATSNKQGRVKLGTVGEPHDGVEVRIDADTGEILTRSAANFVGYWGLPDKTAEVLDRDGWLHTGDVGELVDGTHIRITDRMKDIIITAGGKNIAPSEIENSLKTSPYVKEAVVIGDARKYITALVGIELDTVGDWAQQRGIPFTTYRDLSEKPETLELVRDIVRATNEKFARVEQIKKFRMLPKELDHEDGELTATQKVKRSSMIEMFEPYVEAMYGGEPVGAGLDA